MKQEEHSTASAKQRRLYFVILSVLAAVTIGAIIITLVIGNSESVNPLQQAEESDSENLLQAQESSAVQKTEEDSRSAAVQGDLVKPNSSIEDAKGTDSSVQSADAQEDESEAEDEPGADAQANAAEDDEEAVFDAENDTMMWPVSGNVLMEYSTEGLIYDETLDQYRVNDSISIAAAEGEEVVAAAAGTVKSIGSNDTLGNYVVISHGNGLETTYGQLQEVVDVVEDEFVSKGERIGSIAEPTWYSLSLGTHVQFQVTQDGVAVDPTLYLENTLDE